MKTPFTQEDGERAGLPADAEYRPIEGFPGYLLGDNGTLWSRQRLGRWKQLKARVGRNGYAAARLSRDGEVFDLPLHKLVMEAFVGPCPSGKEIAHDDGDTMNFRRSNLRYDTHKGNHQDRLRHGTSNAGQKNGMSRFTEDDVRQIRRRAQAGDDKDLIAGDFSTSRRIVNKIIRGDRWGHVKD